MYPVIRRLAATALASALIAAASLALRAQLPQEVGTWAPMGPVSQARSGAASVTLPDGRMLVAGGRLADGTVTDAVTIFDPATGMWESAGRLLASRIGHTTTLLDDDHVLVVGGSVGADIRSDVELFDLATGSSAIVSVLTQPRTRHATARLKDGSVLVAGGTTTGGAVLSTVEAIDPETWSATPVAGGLRHPRRNASATTLIDGRVLIAGGNDGTQDLHSAELFTPWAVVFDLLPDQNALAVPRSGHTALLLPHNGSVLIAGGESNGVAVSTADLFLPVEFPDPYSFSIGHFEPAAPMAAARWRANSGPTQDEGHAFVIGGGSQDAERYRFATIRTDLDDYYPGQKAIITGSGWQPGEPVTLLFQEDPAVHDDYTLTVTADALGNIYWDQWAPEEHDLGVRFYLTARDSKSRAQITFTDAVNKASSRHSSRCLARPPARRPLRPRCPPIRQSARAAPSDEQRQCDEQLRGVSLVRSRTGDGGLHRAISECGHHPCKRKRDCDQYSASHDARRMDPEGLSGCQQVFQQYRLRLRLPPSR